MKTKTLLTIVLTFILISCTSPAVRAPTQTAIATESLTPIPPLPAITPTPTVEAGKGRIILNFETTPQEIVVRLITDDFLIGVGSTAPGGCVPKDILQEFRINGLNYFLPFTSWTSIEEEPGNYTNEPCPGDDFIHFAAQSGAMLNGHCLVFLINQPWNIPAYVYGHSYEEQKQMIESFIKAAVQRYPQIAIWTLNEPIAQNALGWSREQVYDLFVSASQWIHETNPDAKVMINLLPIPNDWSGLHYDPNQVLDDLLGKGIEADIIGVELYYGFYAGTQDSNSYPTMEQVKDIIDMFRNYDLPILFSEVGVPGVINGKDNYEQQAQWLEDFFRLAHDDPDVIGAVWYFVRDDSYWEYYGLANNNYSLRPAGNRLMMLAEEWNPSTTYHLNSKNYLDLAPGKYDLVIDTLLNQVNVIDGQATTIPPK